MVLRRKFFLFLHEFRISGWRPEHRRFPTVAIAFFQEAITHDPDFAEAFAYLAMAQSVGHGQRNIDAANMAARRALELDDSLPAAWIATGVTANQRFDFVEAERKRDNWHSVQ
jgi:hypothetical protein